MNFPGISSWLSKVLLFPIWFASVTFLADLTVRWFIFNEGYSFTHIVWAVITRWWLYYLQVPYPFGSSLKYMLVIFGGMLGFYVMWAIFKKWYFLIGSAIFCLFFTNCVDFLMPVLLS